MHPSPIGISSAALVSLALTVMKRLTFCCGNDTMFSLHRLGKKANAFVSLMCSEHKKCYFIHLTSVSYPPMLRHASQCSLRRVSMEKESLIFLHTVFTWWLLHSFTHPLNYYDAVLFRGRMGGKEEKEMCKAYSATASFLREVWEAGFNTGRSDTEVQFMKQLRKLWGADVRPENGYFNVCMPRI